MYKKYSTKFVWSCLFIKYVSYDQFFNSPLPVRSYTYFGRRDPSVSPVVYLLNGWPISERKKITTFEYRIHWKK